MLTKLPPIDFKIETAYNFKLTDSETGKVKQDINAHNIICQGIKYLFEPLSRIRPRPSTLTVGSGVGTPAFTDTTLFSKLWSNVFIPVSIVTVPGYPSVSNIYTYTIPATTAYVGNITEVGLIGESWDSPTIGGSPLMTHCLLKDAEGNQLVITKTDLDILTVTVTFTLTMVINDQFTVKTITERNLANIALKDAQQSILSGLSDTGLSMHKRLRSYMLSNGLPATDNMTALVTLRTGAPTHNSVTNLVSFAAARTLSTAGNTHYYPAIASKYVGIAPLPNEALFPAYAMNGISVGVGDGLIKDFACPLSHFKKDTDKIYVNGVLKVRDVDYTIDNENNSGMFPELSPVNDQSVIVSGGSFYDTQQYVPFMPDWLHIEYRGYNNANPLLINFGKATKINRILVPSLTSSSTASFTVEYSLDNTNWVVALVIPNYSLATIAQVIPETTAQYWRMSFGTSNINRFSGNASIFGGRTGFFGYVGEGIKFTEAPAAGAVITMDCMMDIPFKNSNYVIDIAMQMQF